MFDPERRPVYQDYMVWRGMGDPNVLDKAPEVFTRFQDSTAGCLMTVSEPITQGDDKGKVDWALFQNMPATDFIELFGAMPENKPYIFPHQVTPDAREALHKHAKGFLPHDLVELVTSTGDVTAVPMNDVAVPQSCIKEVGVGHVALVGDALMPVRPHTARGLNNGLQQAANLPGVLRSPELDFVQEWEEATVRSLAHWAMIGQDRAQQFGLGQC